MIESIFDLIDKLPNPIPANAVPYFDGCNWTLITMPASTDCADLLACIDCPFIMSFFSSPNNSIIFNDMGVCGAFDVNPNWINTNITSTWVGSTLTIGTTAHDLSTIFTNNVYRDLLDGISPAWRISNTDTLQISGLDGMRFFMDMDPTSATYQMLVVGLPTNSIVPDPNNQGAPIPGTRQHGQVLTWDAINGYAYRDNNQCCAQTLWLDEATETLHISGTNSVWLGVLNNQQLSYTENLLCISQPNGGSQCIDISETNNHHLAVYPSTANHYMLDILNSNNISQGMVSLEHMNNQTLSYDQVAAPNTLNISQPGGGVQSVVLNRVNNHHLTIVGDQLSLWNSINELMSTVTLPTFDCADVMACTAVQQIITDIGLLAGRVAAAEAQIALLRAELS